MTSYLIGQELGEDLYRLNAELRTATVAEFEAEDGREIAGYSPWLSVFPILKDGRLPDELLQEPTQERGGLVTKVAYLAAANRFMGPRSYLTKNGIYDQKHTDWIPALSVSKDQKAVFDAGRRLLLSSNAMFARMYLEMVNFVLPLPGERNRGFTTHAARGIIYRSIPSNCDKYDVAIDLAHELGHHALMVWQSVDPIIVSDHHQPIYSQIRRTLRPAIQTFHAAVALGFMHHFVETMQQDADCAAAGIRRGLNYTETLKKSLLLSINSLREVCQFSNLGNAMLSELQALAT